MKKQSKKAPYSLRQGDVLLVAASYRGEKQGTEVPTEGGRIVLAHGEVTGHAHAIAEPAKTRFTDVGAERYLQALLSVPVRHEEHTAILLDPNDPASGKYQQAFQVEDHGEEVHRVAD